MPKVYLFTLHKSEEDFRIQASLVAENPQEAAGFWGGQYEAPEDTDFDREKGTKHRRHENNICTSARSPDEIGLCGVVRFDPVLFREPTAYEYGQLGWDSGPMYSHAKLTLFNTRPLQQITLVMRRHTIHVESSVLAMMYHR